MHSHSLRNDHVSSGHSVETMRVSMAAFQASARVVEVVVLVVVELVVVIVVLQRC